MVWSLKKLLNEQLVDFQQSLTLGVSFWVFLMLNSLMSNTTDFCCQEQYFVFFFDPTKKSWPKFETRAYSLWIWHVAPPRGGFLQILGPLFTTSWTGLPHTRGFLLSRVCSVFCRVISPKGRKFSINLLKNEMVSCPVSLCMLVPALISTSAVKTVTNILIQPTLRTLH